MIYQTTGSQKQGGIAIMIFDKVDSRQNYSNEKKIHLLHINKGNNPSRRYIIILNIYE
jgi:hypothetical protein